MGCGAEASSMFLAFFPPSCFCIAFHFWFCFSQQKGYVPPGWTNALRMNRLWLATSLFFSLVRIYLLLFLVGGGRLCYGGRGVLACTRKQKTCTSIISIIIINIPQPTAEGQRADG